MTNKNKNNRITYYKTEINHKKPLQKSIGFGKVTVFKLI